MPMINVRKLALAAATACAAMVVTGCGSDAHYVDTNSNQTVVTVNGIDPQDWNRASADMVQSLLNSGVLSRAARTPAVMAISRIKNETAENVDVDLLVKNIRVALNQSGKVVTSTTIGLGGQAEDPLAKGSVQQQEFYGNTEHQAPDLPDF